MRISTFIPAIMAVAFFSASSAAPTGDLALAKRGNLVDATIKAWADVYAKVLVKARVDLTADLCTDINVDVHATADALGGAIKAKVDVNKLQIQAKAQADVVVKANVDAVIDAHVVANIDAHIGAAIIDVCKTLDLACAQANQHAILVKALVLIKIDLAKAVVYLKANVPVHVKARLNVVIPELTVALGIVNADVVAKVDVRAKVNVHLKAWVDACIHALVNVKAPVDVGAL